MNKSEKGLERRYDIDWLRVLAVLLLIYFHTARIFDMEEFYVNNSPSSLWLTVFVQFVNQWHMPLLFLVSGTATWYSLHSRKPGQYMVERLKRLIIPLIFGTLIVVPPQVYLMRLEGATFGHLDNFEFHGSYLAFYPHFFNGIAPGGNWEWAHLWFLAYLFVFSAVALPLLLFMKEAGRRHVFRLAALCEKPGAIFLLAIPLAAGEAALRAKWPGFQNLYDDWANFFFYITFFIYGYLLCSDERFGQAIDRHLKSSLLLGLGFTMLLFNMEVTGFIPARDYSLRWTLFMVLRGFNSWFWIVAILGLGRKYLRFNNKALRYANEAALPFYVLHQTVIVIIGYYVVKWTMGVAGKYLVITTASLIASIVIYDLLIRRTNLMRFLFGLKSKRKSPLQDLKQARQILQ